MAPGDPGGAILIVLWAGRLQGVKTNPDGRDSLGMEKRYIEGRTQDVAEAQRTPPHRAQAESSGRLGLWRGQAGGRWEQSAAWAQELFPLGVA